MQIYDPAGPGAPHACRARQRNVRPDPARGRGQGRRRGSEQQKPEVARCHRPGTAGRALGSGWCARLWHILGRAGRSGLPLDGRTNLLRTPSCRWASRGETASVAGPSTASPGFRGTPAGSSREAGFRICRSARPRLFPWSLCWRLSPAFSWGPLHLSFQWSFTPWESWLGYRRGLSILS